MLSPVLFAVYLDGLLSELEGSGVGCYWGAHFVGAVCYADDIALLAPCPSAMTTMNYSLFVRSMQSPMGSSSTLIRHNLYVSGRRELWSLSCKSLHVIQVAINNVFRKVWNLPFKSHTAIVHCVARIFPICNLIFHRFIFSI